MQKTGVIVIGGHVQGLGIVRIFGIEGIPSIVLDSTALNLTRFSKYCTSFYKYKEGNLLNFLMESLDKERFENWLLVPTNDSHVKLLSQNKDILEKHFKVSVCKWEVINKVYNKIHTYKIARNYNINIPGSYFVNNIEDVYGIDIKYPCIVKPAIMHTFYSHFNKKVMVCNSFDELKNTLSEVSEIFPLEELIIQEIIEGSSENQYSVCFYFKDQEPVVSLTARRKRQHPINFGNATTFAETVDIPEIKEDAIKFLKAIEFEGICEVEFKYDIRDSKFKLLEVNPRTWKWHFLATVTNTPFLLAMYFDIYEKTPLRIPQPKDGSCQDLITDLFIYLKLRWRKVETNYKKQGHEVVQAVFKAGDIKPFIFQIILLPYFLLKRQ